MAATIIGIKMRSMWTNATDKIWKIVLEILGAMYALMIFGMMVATVVMAVDEGDLAAISQIGVVIAAIILLSWLLFPLFGLGMDATLDPHSFVPYIAPSKKFSRTLLWATPVGLGGVATVLLLGLGTLSWILAGRFLLALLSIVLIPVSLLIYALLARVLSTSVSDYLTHDQKSRDITTAVGAIAFFVVMLGLAYFTNTTPVAGANSLFPKIAKVLIWTPLPGPAIIPNLLYAGQWIPAALQVAYALVLTGFLGWVWHGVVVKSMVGKPTTITPQIQQAIAQGRNLVDPTLAPQAHSAAASASDSDLSRELRSLNLWSRLGAKPAMAALAARTTRDWLKDARLLPSAVAVLMFPALAVIFMYAQIPSGQYSAIMMAALGPFVWGPAIGMLMSYDSTALWMQISAGVSGRTDRFARSLGSQVFILIFALINGAVLARTTNYVVPVVLGIVGTYSLTLITSGLMFALSGRFAFGVQPPGASPFSTKGYANQFVMILAVVGIMLVGSVLMLPFVLSYTLIDQTPLVTTIITVLLLLWGIGVHVVMLLWGGKLLDRNQAKILQQIASWPGH